MIIPNASCVISKVVWLEENGWWSIRIGIFDRNYEIDNSSIFTWEWINFPHALIKQTSRLVFESRRSLRVRLTHKTWERFMNRYLCNGISRLVRWVLSWRPTVQSRGGFISTLSLAPSVSRKALREATLSKSFVRSKSAMSTFCRDATLQVWRRPSHSRGSIQEQKRCDCDRAWKSHHHHVTGYKFLLTLAQFLVFDLKLEFVGGTHRETLINARSDIWWINNSTRHDNGEIS